MYIFGENCSFKNLYCLAKSVKLFAEYCSWVKWKVKLYVYLPGENTCFHVI